MKFKNSLSPILFGLTLTITPWVSSFSSDFSEGLRKQISRFDTHKTFSVSGEPLYSPILLKEFYQNRDFQMAWVDEDGDSFDSPELMSALKQAYREGLRSEDYHWELLTQMLADKKELDDAGYVSPKSFLINLELLLTDSFLTYGSHLLAGRINPTALDETWQANRRDANLAIVLENAFEEENIKEMLTGLFPSQPLYKRMRMALARYYTFQKNENWPTVGEGIEIKRGDTDSRVIPLRKRLHLEGDFRQALTLSEMFDGALERALIRFQKRYGLEETGLLDEKTMAAVNVPIEERVRALRINLERCRWFPDDLGEKHVRVNTADYTMDIVEENRSVMSMKVIVGRQVRETPVFSSTITHMVLNPFWNVPQKIALLDIVPKAQENPEYLTKMKFTVFEGEHGVNTIVDPYMVNWDEMNIETFHYRFRQDPGPQNALGQIKFLFPNDFDVYLHDTPSKRLFDKQVRDFSSGCVRIEKPIEFAEYLLQNDERWSTEAIENGLTKQHEIYINLQEPMPIHIMYWTAWVDEKGRVQFRNDVYGRDTMLFSALNGDLLVYEEGDPTQN